MQSLAHSVLMLIQPTNTLNDSLHTDALYAEIDLEHIENARVYSKNVENNTFFVNKHLNSVHIFI